jgi:DNA repair protein RadA/Sms
LIGGDPGIGKSTLLLQAMSAMSEDHKAIYVSGEESAQQIGLRAQRLDLKSEKLSLLSEIQLNRILDALAREKPDVAVIDSIQTIYSEDIQPAPGSVSQVRECAAQLTRFAKANATALLLVGHVTKEGAIAGPRVLEHIVDTVLYFEGDTHSSFRLIRSIKNRFGAANELGVFAMTDRGLRGVANPSALFLSQQEKQVAGCCVMVTQEGSRPLLVELQALVDTSHSANSRRLTVGLEQNRLAMLLAVLHRHAGVAAFDQDVFVNAVGGVRINEPASDLPVLLAIVSSLRGKVVGGKTVAFGEIGLSGEVRAVQRGQDRLKEAAKLGFNRAIIPTANAPKTSAKNIELIQVDHISQAIDAVFR